MPASASIVVTAMAMPNRPAERVGDDDAGDDDERRQRGRFQRDGEALDDVGAVAGHRGLGDRAHRAVAGAGVVLGDDDDQRRHGEADEGAAEEVQPEVKAMPLLVVNAAPKPPSIQAD